METAAILCAILCAMLCVTDAQPLRIDKDAIFFPDQIEPLRQATSKKCPGGLVFWPVDRRCYEQGSQGPCPTGYVLVLERQHFKPQCVREADALVPRLNNA